jgi:phage FluMu protein gp41
MDNYTPRDHRKAAQAHLAQLQHATAKLRDVATEALVLSVGIPGLTNVQKQERIAEFRARLVFLQEAFGPESVQQIRALLTHSLEHLDMAVAAYSEKTEEEVTAALENFDAQAADLLTKPAE